MKPIPRKRFGQHFLNDQTIITQILTVLAPREYQHLIEIGPGQGALTLPLLKAIKYLEAIELDRDLILELKKRSSDIGELIIYSADALTFDFAKLKQDERLLRIVGNLPYNISTMLLFHLLKFAPLIQDMLFMLQKEVAERLAAKANTTENGRLSIMVQYHCQVDLLFNVSAQAFYPPPQVESSMVSLKPYRIYPYQADNYLLFEKIVKLAFGQRRKTLRNSLKELISDNVWAHLPIHSDLRAENLSVKDFVVLSNALEKYQTL
jgi:16S rRNA (adenine1518-N6/adenine1519-N6)-dimethyltransferase